MEELKNHVDFKSHKVIVSSPLFFTAILISELGYIGIIDMQETIIKPIKDITKISIDKDNDDIVIEVKDFENPIITLNIPYMKLGDELLPLFDKDTLRELQATIKAISK